MRSLLEAARLRLEEPRAVSRYLLGLLIMLGIAGALWPLIAAPDARIELATLLLGLASAVLLGVLHLELRHAQGAFVGELEEFLSERAQLPSALLGGEGPLPAYVEALLKQAAESLTDLQRMMTRADEDRSSMQAAIKLLTEELAALSDQLRAEHKVITALSKNHSELQPAMRDFANELASGLAGAEELRNHVRSMDLALARLVEEVAQIREQLPQALRQEVRVLAQTMTR
jgi:acyl transferase domain-containing protein